MGLVFAIGILVGVIVMVAMAIRREDGRSEARVPRSAGGLTKSFSPELSGRTDGRKGE